MLDHRSPESVYSMFVQRRNFIESCWIAGICTDHKRKCGLADLYAEYMELMGEELFETFLEAERKEVKKYEDTAQSMIEYSI